MTISPPLARLSLPASPTSSFQLTTPRKISHGESPLSRSTVGSDHSWTAAAQPPLLFGSSKGDTTSIWSTQLDAPKVPVSSLSLSFGGSPVPPPMLSPPAYQAQHAHHSRWPSNLSQTVSHLPHEEPFQSKSPANFLNSSQRGSIGPGSQPFGINTNVYTPTHFSTGFPPEPDYNEVERMNNSSQGMHDAYHSHIPMHFQSAHGPPTVQSTSRMWAPP